MGHSRDSSQRLLDRIQRQCSSASRIVGVDHGNLELWKVEFPVEIVSLTTAKSGIQANIPLVPAKAMCLQTYVTIGDST